MFIQQFMDMKRWGGRAKQLIPPSGAKHVERMGKGRIESSTNGQGRLTHSGKQRECKNRAS